MQLRIVVLCTFMIGILACSKAEVFSREEWIEKIENEDYKSLLSIINKNRVVVENANSSILQSAIESQHISLLEYLIDNGKLERNDIISGYEKSARSQKKTWQYLLNYDAYKNPRDKLSSSLFLSNSNYFPDLILNYRLLSDPETNTFSEYKANKYITNLNLFFPENLKSSKTFDKLIKKYYRDAEPLHILFIRSLFYLKADTNKKKNDIYDNIKILAKKGHLPAVYYIVDNEYDFYGNNISLDEHKNRRELLLLAAKSGNSLAVNELISDYGNMLSDSDYESLRSSLLLYGDELTYREVINSLLELSYVNSEHVDFRNKLNSYAAVFFLDAVKDKGLVIQYVSPNNDNLSKDLKIDFIEAYILQGDVKKANKLILSVLTQQLSNEQEAKLVSLVLESNYKPDGKVLKALFQYVDIGKYHNSLIRLGQAQIIDGMPLIAYLIEQGRFQLANGLVESESHFDEEKYVYSSLYMAILAKQHDLVKELIKKSSSEMLQKRYGVNKISLLHLSVSVADLNFVEEFSTHKALLELEDSNGLTALDWAIQLNLTDIAELLATEMGIDIKGIEKNSSNDCLVDEVSGLMWLNKNNDGNSIFSWESKVHVDNPSICDIEACSIKNVIKYLNEVKYCGIGNWRIPSVDELLSIDDNLLFSLKGKPADSYFVRDKRGNLVFLNITEFTSGVFSVNPERAHIWPVNGIAKKLVKNLNGNLFSVGQTRVINDGTTRSDIVKRSDTENFNLAKQFYFGHIQKESKEKALVILNYLKAKDHSGSLAFFSYHHELNNQPKLAFQFALAALENAKEKQWVSFAKVRLGHLYLNGIGTKLDEESGVSLLKDSANLENVEAIVVLSNFYQQRAMIKEHLQYQLQAAELGHIESQRAMGLAYAFGYGPFLGQNNTKAVEWYRKASSSGDKLATQQLIRAYTNGELGLDFSQEEIDVLKKRL
ncbi:hypothetical protein PMAN_b0289 [Pseudoalteromonas marina]|uniref:ankyrin repeat domain-containing protein n=1 Tax=Pseudoalteromonas marina TaxID=267375 RepID=UPI00026D1280|nr:ankyrin repeat domain-containing protein [Pseudoalteromonas marina]KAF7772696.1 hypothetical protein PMAN_b0289 [Pseudoalteromonas marina]